MLDAVNNPPKDSTWFDKPFEELVSKTFKYKMKKFRIYKDKKSQIVEADRVEWKKDSTGLAVKFFIGKKVSVKFSDVACLVELSPEIVPVKIKEKTYLDED